MRLRTQFKQNNLSRKLRFALFDLENFSTQWCIESADIKLCGLAESTL